MAAEPISLSSLICQRISTRGLAVSAWYSKAVSAGLLMSEGSFINGRVSHEGRDRKSVV
jgi:hypothetical protein